MKITIRQRQRGPMIRLYLHYYHKGKNKRESLGLALYPEPEQGKLDKAKKAENQRTLQIAEIIRSKRLIEFQNGEFGLKGDQNLKASFLAYMKEIAKGHFNINGTYGTWDSVIKQLEHFTGGKDILFQDLSPDWLKAFKTYLAQVKDQNTGKGFSQNTQYTYFNKVKAALRQAHNEGILDTNLSTQVSSPKQAEVHREYLTLEELQALQHTECPHPMLKRAFIFSALTGLRWSDLSSLRWEQVKHSAEQGWHLQFTQKKTGAIEYLPISNETREHLGPEGNPKDKVFGHLLYSSSTNQKLQQWVQNAGIQKKITFHSARHTNATLLLSKGVDIYTVSKMLGHKNVKTTQIYAKVIDEKKQEAAKTISLKKI